MNFDEIKWKIYSLDYMCAVVWERMKQKAPETGAEISIDSGIFSWHVVKISINSTYDGDE